MANTNIPGSPNPNGLFAPLPGQKQGLTQKQVQAIINSSKRAKGFVTPLPAAQITPQQIEISGTANWLLGFALFPRDNHADPAATPRMVSLMINDEQALQPSPFNLLDKRYIEGEYYVFPRPLSGSDDIILVYDNTNGLDQDVEAIFYYL